MLIPIPNIKETFFTYKQNTVDCYYDKVKQYLTIYATDVRYFTYYRYDGHETALSELSGVS